VNWAGVRRGEVQFAGWFQDSPNLAQCVLFAPLREMFDDIKERSGIERTVTERQVEYRACYELHCCPCLMGTYYHAVDAHVVLKTHTHDG
jgi:hypothetical protein